MVRVWVMNGVHDNVGDLTHTTTDRLVGEIVGMEIPVESLQMRRSSG